MSKFGCRSNLQQGPSPLQPTVLMLLGLRTGLRPDTKEGQTQVPASKEEQSDVQVAIPGRGIVQHSGHTSPGAMLWVMCTSTVQILPQNRPGALF